MTIDNFKTFKNSAKSVAFKKPPNNKAGQGYCWPLFPPERDFNHLFQWLSFHLSYIKSIQLFTEYCYTVVNLKVILIAPKTVIIPSEALYITCVLSMSGKWMDLRMSNSVDVSWSKWASTLRKSSIRNSFSYFY